MGNDTSVQAFTPIPQLVSICATEPRFILDRPVTLFISFNALACGTEFQIKCATTEMDYFSCESNPWSFSEKKTLRDFTGVPILNIKNKLPDLFCQPTYTVYSGKSSDKMICNIKPSSYLIKTKIATMFQFQDVVTGKMHRVVLKVSGWTKKGNIFLGEPKQGGVPIAKITRPTSGGGDLCGMGGYYLEIAPGVDTALMVCMCIAMEKVNGF